MATTFDTLRTARELEAAGLDTKQAEAIAAAIRDGQGDLVTRPYLRAELFRALFIQGVAIVGLLKVLELV